MTTQATRMAVVLIAAGLIGGVAAHAAPSDDHRRGMEAYARGDVVGAMSALRPAAKAGHAPSQSLLAFILMSADFAEEAAALYRDAAAQGDADGHAGLATAYVEGRGVAKDEKLALQHFLKAADLGHGKSIEVVADAHLQGRLGLAGALAADSVAAVRRAADKGYLPAVDALSEAYRVGRWDLAADAQQSAQWKARAAELRAQRTGPAPPRRGSR